MKASRALTGYQIGLGVVCALGVGLAIWLTSTDPTITYAPPGNDSNLTVTCAFSSDVGSGEPSTGHGYRVDRGHTVLDGDAARAINARCAQAERSRLRLVVWVLAGVLAVGAVLMATYILRVGRRRME